MRRTSFGQPLLGMWLGALLAGGQLIVPASVRSESLSPAQAQPPSDPGKASSPAPSVKSQSAGPASSAQESKPNHQKIQSPKNEDPKPKEEVKGEEKKSEDKKAEEKKADEGAEKEKESKEKESAGKRTVSSLILTVKLAMIADPRLFPYEIEVEGGADEIVLSGKVSSEGEKSIAGAITRTVPAVKNVVNKIDIVKELPDVLARKQDDMVTHQVKERFARSATLKAAGFEVKTEGGVVSLGGTVRFQVFIWEAAEAAREVPGVKAVKTDKVKIESEG